MTTHVLEDAGTLTGRSLRHILRSPDTIITTVVTPIALMLLFVYVLGGAIDTGETGTGGINGGGINTAQNDRTVTARKEAR